MSFPFVRRDLQTGRQLVIFLFEIIVANVQNHLVKWELQIRFQVILYVFGGGIEKGFDDQRLFVNV